MKWFTRLLFGFFAFPGVFSKGSPLPEVGGSNYAFIDIGAYAAHPGEATWNSDVLVPVVHYHTHQTKIRQQLDFLRSSGQKKIAVMIWYVESGLGCVLRAHYVCQADNGLLPPQARDNITNLLRDISARGFEQVQIRLAPQSVASPTEWTKWEENLFQNNVRFIIDIRQTVEKAMVGSNTARLYDLGVELMGHPVFMTRPIYRQYLIRLWKEWSSRFGSKDSVGFSFNHADLSATIASLDIFRSSGAWPVALAFDIYSDPVKNLKNIAKAFEQLGVSRQQALYIQETYRNDPETLQLIQQARQDLGLNIRWIMQWSVGRNSKVPHVDRVDYSYDVYLKGVKAP